MAGWLSRATSLFQQTPPPAEPFVVECDCGGRVTGERMGVYQKPTCSLCERPVFVLPVNVYPFSKPKSKTKSRTSDDAKATRPPSTVVIDDQPASPSAGSSTTKSVPIKGTLARPTPTLVPSLVQEPRPKLVTPLRLVAVAIFAMSALTISGLWRRYSLESARLAVSQAADAGMAAIEERDFPKAAREMERARRAVDLLGRTDQTAVDIRRFDREATALAKLATGTLTECLQETLATGKPGQAEPLRLSSVNKGAWMIFDASVFPASKGKNRFIVDAPMVLNDGIVRIEIESPVFQKRSRPSESGEPSRFIFAAQLEQLSSLKGKPPTAVLTLNGSTAFLWTSYDTYRAIEYQVWDPESEKQIRMILDEQNTDLPNANLQK